MPKDEIEERKSEKKSLPCLKCGKPILTYIHKRLCPNCHKSNEKVIDITGKFITESRSAKQSGFKGD